MPKKSLQAKSRGKKSRSVRPPSVYDSSNDLIASWADVEGADYQGSALGPVPLSPEEEAEIAEALRDFKMEQERFNRFQGTALDEIVRIRRELRRRWDQNDLSALGDALNQYIHNGVPMERWALDLLKRQMNLKTKPRPPGRRGRKPSIGEADTILNAGIKRRVSEGQSERAASKNAMNDLSEKIRRGYTPEAARSAYRRTKSR